jgi:hypothetical protein
MVTCGIIVAIAAVAGFGAGRVKNAKKLTAVANELASIEAGASADLKAVIAKVKSKL